MKQNGEREMNLSQIEEAEQNNNESSFPDDEKKWNKKERKKKKGHKRLIVYIFLLTVLILIYTLFSLYFKDHYFPNTIIDGTDCSYKTSDMVKKLIKEKTKDYELNITGRNITSYKITGREIDLKFLFDEKFNSILENQQPIFWPIAFFQENRQELKQSAAFDNSKLENILMKSPFVDQNAVDPTDATISAYDSKANSYRIIADKQGTKLIADTTKEKVKTAIESLSVTFDLDKSGCYESPKISADDPELKKIVDEANKAVSSKIQYDWNSHPVSVEGALISQWMDVSDSGVKLKEDSLTKWIAECAYKYDTYGKKRTFTTFSGEQKTLPSGSYGWRTNRTAELEKLEENIKSGKKVSREPVYSHTAVQKGDDDIGKSYVEINLSMQHVYVFIDGKDVFETDCVTGNMAKGNGTPAGVFGITYKERNATLQGENYATPVNYWMPFNGNIGMHDAVWRNTFGGTIYLTSGSHGCVNLPPSSAQTIYGEVQKGFPVVCYY